jgi:hypothetical protein
MNNTTSKWKAKLPNGKVNPPNPQIWESQSPPIGGLKIRIVLKSTRWVAEKEE